MGQKKYLYGAAVQGIQGFIFQTNKLQEIVGASELVEEICTELFKETVTEQEYESNTVLHAAGNIKHIFTSRETCERVVREFPKKVVGMAPGITISQAVVEMEGGDFSTAVDELERKLKAQRNKPMNSTTVGLMGIDRNQRTGLPIMLASKNQEDEATYSKLYEFEKLYGNRFHDPKRRRTTKTLCEKAFGIENLTYKEIAYDIDKMNDTNSWVAVIHADGNGLGQIVQKVGKEKDDFSEFSRKLDVATTNAAVKAFNDVFAFEPGKKVEIRPIVLGGDDLTVVCRADKALAYTHSFLRHFEDETKALKNILKENKVFVNGEDHLTACAGIAYIKESYPFYYGYELAEMLCSKAKKDAKKDLKDGELPASCLMFHKVQDSFVKDYDDMVNRELRPQHDISFEFGPYYLYEQQREGSGARWTIRKLASAVDLFDSSRECNAVKSKLRQWLSALHEGEGQAKQHLIRTRQIAKESNKEDIVNTCVAMRVEELKEGKVTKYPTYDILALHSLTQKTKEE